MYHHQGFILTTVLGVAGAIVANFLGRFEASVRRLNSRSGKGCMPAGRAA